MIIFLKNAKVLSKSCDGMFDLLLNNGIIEKIFSCEDTPDSLVYDECIDLNGKTLIPGIIDMHVHLREPGYEYKETIESGLKAAVKGGVTTVGVMPNTDPVIDNEYLVEYLKMKSELYGLSEILPIGAVTKKSQGVELAPMINMAKRGAIAFSDDGNPVENAHIMLKALEYYKMTNKPIINHAEVKELSKTGFMREGEYSNFYGIYGIPSVAESIMVARDIELAKYTDAHVHIAHVSTQESLNLIKNAKKDGVKVSCEVTHNHLIFTDKDLKDYSTSFKVNPPLADEKSRNIFIQALKDDLIDIIVTDHAPHADYEKEVEFQNAPNGISGLDTLLSSLLKLSIEEDISLKKLIEKVTYYPTKIFNLEKKGDIKEGYFADLVILNENEIWNVNNKTVFSKGKNTPFMGMDLPGVVEYTFIKGKKVYSKEDVLV
jgi:dihydroorotase